MPNEADANKPPPHGLDLLAGLLACLVPGLGHLYRGEPKRAAAAAIGVLGLFFGGMLIGGIDVVDSREDKWWYYGQVLTGPIAVVTDIVHQNYFKAIGPLRAENARPGTELLRSGYPDEQRVVDDNGVARWRLLTSEQIASGLGPPNSKSLGRVNEIGTLYGLIGGMLNLIIILDALFPTLRPRGGTETKGARVPRDNPSPALSAEATP